MLAQQEWEIACHNGKKKKNYSWLLNKESLKCLVPLTHGFFFSTEYVLLLSDSNLCAQHTKRPNKPKFFWSGEMIIYFRALQGERDRPKLPNGLQGRSFYRQDLESGLQAVWLSSGLTAGKVTGWCFRNLNHQPSGSKVGSTCFAQAEVTILYLGGSLNSYRRTQRCVSNRYIHILLGETRFRPHGCTGVSAFPHSPGSSDSEECVCSAGYLGSNPWRREWLPSTVFLPGELHGQRRLAGYSPCGCKELDIHDWVTNTPN